jgi:cell division protein FtsN
VSFNDGKLIHHIHEETGRDIQDIENEISKYHREIQAVVNVGNDFIIKGLGKFVKINDAIEFINESDFSCDPIVVESKNEEHEPPTLSPHQSAPISQSPSSNLQPPVASNQSSAASGQEPEATPRQPAATPQSSVASGQEPAATPQESRKKRRGIFFFVNILLLLLIIGGGVYSYLYFDQVSEWIGIKKEQREVNDKPAIENKEIEAIDEIVDQPPVEETILEDQELQSESEVTEELVESQFQTVPVEIPAVSSIGNFHIVVGTFSVKENAERLVTKIKDAGYDGKILMTTDLGYTVAFHSYPTKEDATQNIEKAKSITGTSAYVMKR